MKFASFDLEIIKEIPEDTDWKEIAPLGISCAAAAVTEYPEIRFWQSPKGLDVNESQVIVRDLQNAYNNGYIPLTWNGTSFDFQVLAQESGLYNECAKLALEHIDMMMIITFTKGWYVGLQSVCDGVGIKGKLKEVKLNDGSILTEMTGARAPELWAKGEYDAVLEYLKDDVTQPLELAHYIEKNKTIKWKSKSGNTQTLYIPKLLTARECFQIPKPDNSWMDNPPQREDFVSWMPGQLPSAKADGLVSN